MTETLRLRSSSAVRLFPVVERGEEERVGGERESEGRRDLGDEGDLTTLHDCLRICFLSFGVAISAIYRA